MNIGIDVDNTLADLAQGAHAAYHSLYENEPEKPLETFNTWNNEDFPGGTNRLMELFRFAWENWYDFIEPTERHIHVPIEDLRAAGHTIHIITNRDITNHSHVVEFLADTHVPYDMFSINGRVPHISKLSFPIDVLIDDHPKMGREAENAPGQHVLLYDRIWNRTIPDTNNLTRIHSLRDAANYILNGHCQV